MRKTFTCGTRVVDIWDDPLNAAPLAELVHWLGRRQGVIPFVGAGLSVPWGFPTWWEFLTRASVMAGVADAAADALARDDYETAAQYVEDALGKDRFHEQVQAVFGVPVDPEAVPDAAVHQLPKVASGPVITTNFDHVLETAFRAAGRSFELPLWGARVQLALDGLAEDYPVLLKLHGDALHKDRVFTRRQYADEYGVDAIGADLRKPLPDLLMRLFRSRSLLFVGASLVTDRTMLLLAESRRQGGNIPHFAVLPRPEDAQLGARTAFLAEFGIEPIWYARDEHGLIAPFLRTLAAHAPPWTGAMRMPGPVPSTLSSENMAARARARTARETLERLKEKLLAHWTACTGSEQRKQFFREHHRALRENWPRLLLPIAEQIVAEQERDDPGTAAIALISAHWAAIHLDEMALAETAMQKAEAMLMCCDDAVAALDLLHTRAGAARRAGDYVGAERISREFLKTARVAGFRDSFALRRAHALRASVLFRLGKRRAARRYLARAVRSARRDRHREDLATHLMAASNFHFVEDRPAAMAVAAKAGLRVVLDEHLRLRALLAGNLGVALYELNRYVEALTAHREALWCEHEGESDPENIVTILMNLAHLELDAFAGRTKLGVPGSDAIRQAALRRAANYYEQARIQAEAADLPSKLAHVDVQHALVLSALNEPLKALKALRRAIRVLREEGDLGYLATAYNNRGVVWSAIPGKLKQELAAYRVALALARKAGEPGILRTILRNYGPALRQAGRSDEAAALEAELRLQHAGT